MNKITVIQLLNKIANGEEVPKKILIRGYEYRFSNDYQNENIHNINFAYEDKHMNYWLDMVGINEEVEIIEEDKEIEEIKELSIRWRDNDIIINEKIMSEDIEEELAIKINKLVKAVNELKKGK